MVNKVSQAPLACIIGPTASGKSALALALARRFPERRPVILSMDSAQVYRGMDIGSAKPSLQEQAELPHRLIDCRDPEDRYSVAQFLRDLHETVAEVRAAGQTPLLVGGTMLYYKALRDGLDDLPSAPDAIRAALAREAQALGWPALYAQLAEQDPKTAARLAPNDAQRISRALEVFRATGRTLTDWLSTSPARLPGMPVRTLALLPTDRAWLHRRLAQRFHEMVAMGLLTEVRALMARPGLSPDHPSMRSVGYRQAWAHLAGQDPDWIQHGIEASRQLAKRQITWLRQFESQPPQPLVLDPSVLSPDQLIETSSAWFLAGTT